MKSRLLLTPGLFLVGIVKCKRKVQQLLTFTASYKFYTSAFLDEEITGARNAAFLKKNQYSCPQKSKFPAFSFIFGPNLSKDNRMYDLDEPYQSVLYQLASTSCSFPGKCIQYHHHSDHRPENSPQVGSGFLPYHSQFALKLAVGYTRL